MKKLLYLRNKYMYVDVGRNGANYWFEFRICGIGIDINWEDYTAGIDICTKKVSSYATDIQRKRLLNPWSNQLSLKGKLIKWYWLNLGWTRGFHMYPINQYPEWKRGLS